MYLDQAGHIYFYSYVPDEKGNLSSIEIEVETDHPFKAFPPSRTALSQQLDIMIRYTWLPLLIMRLDLFIKGEEAPIAHQLLLPFPDTLRILPSGGHHQFPVFAAYESLVREAVASTSPYYRFLCAYRAYEGIGDLRRTIREMAEKASVTAPLPKPPAIDIQLLKSLGFPEPFLQCINNADDLRSKFKEDRNAIAHFLLKDAPLPVDLSNGFAYRGYAVAGSVLLYYCQKAVMDLFVYFNAEIYHHVLRGSILIEPEHKDKFVIKPDRYWPSQPQAKNEP